MNNISERKEKELNLPSAELLEKYDSISKGMSKQLIELVKKEQAHRHKMQNKYLMQFRIGQIVGSILMGYIIYSIFTLIKAGFILQSYILTGIFFALIIFIFWQYRKDKFDIAIRNNKRNNGKQYSNNFHYRKNYPAKTINNSNSVN